MILQLRSPVRPAKARPTSTAANHRQLTTDAARRRDPTQCNDLRRRLQTQLRRCVNDWRQRAYEAIVKSDVLGYQFGDVHQLEELTYELNNILKQQAFVTMSPAYDNLAMTLRTAYGRGVNAAIVELHQGVPLPTDEAVVQQAFNDLANIIDSQLKTTINQIAEEPEKPLRSRWLLWSAILLPTLFRAINSRINALATTNVTRAYNGGKLDIYEQQDISEVGVEPETLPSPEPLHPWEIEELEELEAEEELEPAVRIAAVPATIPLVSPQPAQPQPAARPSMRLPKGLSVRPSRRQYYSVQTMGDDKVCAICQSYEGNAYTLFEARRLIPAHPHCRCAVVPITVMGTSHEPA